MYQQILMQELLPTLEHLLLTGETPAPTLKVLIDGVDAESLLLNQKVCILLLVQVSLKEIL